MSARACRRCNPNGHASYHATHPYCPSKTMSEEITWWFKKWQSAQPRNRKNISWAPPVENILSADVCDQSSHHKTRTDVLGIWVWKSISKALIRLRVYQRHSHWPRLLLLREEGLHRRKKCTTKEKLVAPLDQLSHGVSAVFLTSELQMSELLIHKRRQPFVLDVCVVHFLVQ